MLLFKKDIKYSIDGKTLEGHMRIFKSGEEYSLDSVLNVLGKNNLEFWLKNGVIESQKQEVPLVENILIDTQTPQEVPVIQNQDEPQTVFEIMYKTTQPIQDKGGNEIEVGSQFTESELKEIISQDKRQSKKKIKDLLEEQKLMEVKKL